jgi:Bacterial capsule synthesis protein PGA_cap
MNAGSDASNVYVVGDVGPCRREPRTIFDRVRSTLACGDLCICQLEPVLSKRGSAMPQARLAMRTHPEAAAAIHDAGFHGVSFASNHCMDWGNDAFFDTIDALRAADLKPIGVGANIREARQPGIFEVNGTRIAILAYNSILPTGYWAEENRAGCVPLRASTLYEQIEHDQPGTPARIHTFAHRGDLAAMCEDIRAAKANADIIIAMMHWGIHFVPAVLADYQLEAAHAAIDAGADLIAGHHPHLLKGVEVYRGKVILYSLGNFALDLPSAFQENVVQGEGFRPIQALNPRFNPSAKSFLPPETRKSVIARCAIRGKTLEQVTLLPVYLSEQAEPEILDSKDHRFGEVLEYLKEITAAENLNGTFHPIDAEILIE